MDGWMDGWIYRQIDRLHYITLPCVALHYITLQCGISTRGGQQTADDDWKQLFRRIRLAQVLVPKRHCTRWLSRRTTIVVAGGLKKRAKKKKELQKALESNVACPWIPILEAMMFSYKWRHPTWIL